MRVTPFQGRQAGPDGVFYAEDRGAIRWPYYFHLALWGLVLVVGAVAAGATGNPNWAWPIAAGAAGTLLSAGFAAQNWPVGIRVGGDGIRIGGVRRQPRPRRDPPWADYQRRQALFAPWDAVRRAAVITGRPALRDTRSLRKQGIIRLGVLSAPFTRSALLLQVDPDRVVLPQFREPDIDRPFWRPAHMAPVEVSPVWYVPTRRPSELRAALAQQALPSPSSLSTPSSPGGPGASGGPGGSGGSGASGALGGSGAALPAHLRLLFERADATREA